MKTSVSIFSSWIAIAVIGLPFLAGAESERALRARLSGDSEVPLVLTDASGSFAAKVSARAERIEYELSYEGLRGDAIFAHIHLGQRFANGGVLVFLCNNEPSIPAPVPPCPVRGGSVRGTLTADNVLGPPEQGVEPGDFKALLRALQRGRSYVNVHSTASPSGELRGQIR